jgi:hypothetical protein
VRSGYPAALRRKTGRPGELHQLSIQQMEKSMQFDPSVVG